MKSPTLLEASVDASIYEKESAARRIASYFFPTPYESISSATEQPFLRAKTEAVKHLRRELACIEVLSLEDYLIACRRRGLPPPEEVPLCSCCERRPGLRKAIVRGFETWVCGVCLEGEPAQTTSTESSKKPPHA